MSTKRNTVENNTASTQGRVPKLRFPEFSGEWEEKRLGDIADIVGGGSPRPIDGFITVDRKRLNWLKIGDVGKNSKYTRMTELA